MLVFGNDTKSRGCFTFFNLNAAMGRGAYLAFPDSTELPGPGNVDPFIVTGISFGQKEKFSLVPCFNNTTHVYAFGHDPASSIISVQFVAFLVARDGTTVSDALKKMLVTYIGNRLSERPEYVEVFLGDRVLRGFLISMSSSTADAHHNLQNFTIDLLTVEVQGL